MTILLGLIGLSLLVFFHELGHFTVAKLCGVKVEAFSIGMGPVLLHHTWGDTDYRVSLLPIGGYCTMKGENDYQEALDAGLSEINGDSDSFYGVHPLRRLLIAFAGPCTNFLLGFLFFSVIALLGYTYYSEGTTVQMADEVIEGLASRAHEAGMQSGDTITSLNGNPVANFSDIREFIAVHPDEDIVIGFIRDGNNLTVTAHTDLDKETGAGKIGIVADADSVTEQHYGPYSLPGAIVEGASQTGKMIALTFKSIGILFKGVDLTKTVSGPARIASMLGHTVTEGFAESINIGIVSTLQLLALISISLFIMNLLPAPVLDGGLILFACIEWVLHRKIPPKVLYYSQFVGLTFIGILMVLAVTGDVRYFFFK